MRYVNDSNNIVPAVKYKTLDGRALKREREARGSFFVPLSDSSWSAELSLEAMELAWDLPLSLRRAMQSVVRKMSLQVTQEMSRILVELLGTREWLSSLTAEQPRRYLHGSVTLIDSVFPTTPYRLLFGHDTC